MPDWRDAAAYAPLLDADRSLFAWEWLRREPLYRAAVEHARQGAPAGGPGPSPEAFGLVEFEPPARAVPDARPIWRADIHPLVLIAEPGSGLCPDDWFALERLGGIARLVRGPADHLLLTDGLRTIRLDAPLGTFDRGPLYLRYGIGGLASAEPALLALRRFLALCRTGQFSRSLHPRETRARRWIVMLRAHDAVRSGASHRDIAGHLLSRSVVGPRWRSREPSVRSQVQRLVRAASACAHGGYRVFLGYWDRSWQRRNSSLCGTAQLGQSGLGERGA